MIERKMSIAINAEDEFSGVLDRFKDGIESTALSAAEIGAGFETATDKIKELTDRFGGISQGNGAVAGLSGGLSEAPSTAAVRIQEMSNAGVDGASSAKGTGAVDETASRAEEEYQRELEAKSQQNTALFEMDQEYKRRTIELDRNTWDARLKIAGSTTGQMANMMQNLYVATGSKNKAMFEVGKAFAIAETVINTRAAAMAAYKSLAGIPYIGPFLGVAAAAAAIAAGAAQIQEIRSAQPGGGSVSASGMANPSYSGGSASSQPVPMRLEAPDEKLTQKITVNINTLEGTEVNWQKIAEENIKPALENLKDRNVILDILTT